MAITIFLFLLATICLIIAGACFEEFEVNGGGGIAMLFFGLILLIIGCLNVDAESKKQGQIDAINGKIYYELKTNPDSTREWMPIKEKQ